MKAGLLSVLLRKYYSILHRPYIDRTSTPHRPHIDPTLTLHRPHIDPTSTLHRPLIDPTSTPYRPHIPGPTSTSHGPYIDPTSTLRRPNITSRLTRIALELVMTSNLIRKPYKQENNLFPSVCWRFSCVKDDV